ncbi:MAG: hypothetical protein U0746_20395 [Gemmataceae bacterium]
MTEPSDRFADRPMQEWLAAYVDGELDSVGRAQVERWLAENPEAWAELEAQHRYSGTNAGFWRWTAAPTPREGTWSRTFANIRDAIAQSSRSTRPPERTSRSRVVAVAAIAAVALLAIHLLRPTPPGRPDGLSPPVEEALALAGEDDIEIVSLPGADEDTIVVGRLPLDGPIVLATVADVALERVNRDTDGMMPIVQGMQAGPNAPMIIAPMPGR